METYLIDSLFEKYSNYSVNLYFKDSVEAENNETEESKLEFQQLIKRLADRGYYSVFSDNEEKKEEILNDCLKDYTEKNQYYLKLMEISTKDIFTLRNLPHLSILKNEKSSTDLSLNEESEFNKIFKEEIDYFNVAQFRYDFSTNILFSKLSMIFILFSTILRMIKSKQDIHISELNVNEYYLNNFLVSHGFLLYNNIPYDKKRHFCKSLMSFYSKKGSLEVIKNIIEILHDKESTIYEYYLFYDELNYKYYFLKVQPNESFINVVNNLRNEREENFYSITSLDDSWMATEEDLFRNNVRFIKTKYFSIDTYSDVSEAIKEVTFITNKLRKYKDLFGEIYKFSIDGFEEGVELTDFLMFLTLLSLKLNRFDISTIKNLKVVEDTTKYSVIPTMWESSIYEPDKRKTLSDLLSESVDEIVKSNSLNKLIEQIKKEEIIDKNKTKIDKIIELKRELKTKYTNTYRPPINDKKTTKTFDYLCDKYNTMKSDLNEEDLSIISQKFTNYLNYLEKVLMSYGQSALKIKDLYSNLYLPKIIEIIKYFKSLNSYLLNFDNTLSIDKENRIDIMSDSTTYTGTIKINNRDKYGSGNIGDEDYKKEENSLVVNDFEIDYGNEYLNKSESPTKDEFMKNNECILFDYPNKSSDIGSCLYRSFSFRTPFVTSSTGIFDTEKRIENILKDNSKMFFNNSILDFYGSEGSYKEYREKYNLSYVDFKDKVSNILKKYNWIFGSVINRLGINKEELLYTNDTTKLSPYMKKDYLYRRITNKVIPEDLLYRCYRNRGFYTDVVNIYRYNNETNNYELDEILSSKYRTQTREMENSKNRTHPEPHTGVRGVRNFINELKLNKEIEKNENNLIGWPEIK